ALSNPRTNTRNPVNTLASGTVSGLGTNTWHTISLAFNGSSITARIDGSNVGTVTDATFPVGQIGFASSWNYQTQWDNLTITGTTPPPSTAGPVRNVAANRCLDVSGGSMANGAQVIIWDCNANTNQRWTNTAAGELRV